jgi:hypothetical protein
MNHDWRYKLFFGGWRWVCQRCGKVEASGITEGFYKVEMFNRSFTWVAGAKGLCQQQKS